ncbi:phosphomannomutase [Cotonvirus japonicus]|uniref:phosphomannomutase n=1 Tax=Cotonvirus japonicus TaxID=2811091 RepID=A0ABM7NT47_9VIRU|nr:phosphomannomutase [Cotonvirus japonicus]BCS83345.1 phosphomannomutase [Cotonvirus japonicus]
MTIILFDVDGTLTPSGQEIQQEMIECLNTITSLPNIELGLVGGGTYDKIKSQLLESISLFKYVFAECGAVIYVNGKLIQEKSMFDHCNREKLNYIIKIALSKISKMPIMYSGCQIDCRKGLVYISPPGMQATDYERNYFIESDKKFNLRENLLNQLKTLDIDQEFEICYGGNVGIAVYPVGWNKAQIMDFINDNVIFDKIYFFGDRTDPTGNDYPLYSHHQITGISVTDYFDTIIKLGKIFLSNHKPLH